MQVETLGSGPRVVLVHGSMSGPGAWSLQRPLAARWRLELVSRPGFPPGPPVERVDFEREAPLLATLLAGGAHLVGHSYGGVVSLLAAAARPQAVRSLTVLEPPCFGVARGDPAVEELVARIERYWADGPPEPLAFAEGFLRAVGSPAQLGPEHERAARTLQVERLPSEAEIPLAQLRRTPFPKLVVSGGHSAAFDAVCDVLERELGAERAVVAGAGHGTPRAGEALTRVLEDFLDRAERS